MEKSAYKSRPSDCLIMFRLGKYEELRAKKIDSLENPGMLNKDYVYILALKACNFSILSGLVAASKELGDIVFG